MTPPLEPHAAQRDPCSDLALRRADVDCMAIIGVDRNMLAAAQIRRVTSDEARASYGIRYHGNLEGILIPYFDPLSDQRVTARLRRDHPDVDTQGKLIAKYLSPRGDNRHLYFPPGAGELLSDVSVPVVIVEAEKSSLALTSAAHRAGRRLLVVALGGCWSWRGRIGKSTDANGAPVDEHGALPDLSYIVWAGRVVMLLFDANAATNFKVKASRSQLGIELGRRGAVVRNVHLPEETDVNGPDDYRAKHDDAALLALLDNATAKPADLGTGCNTMKISQGTRIVDLALGAGIELWHTPTGDAHITLPSGDHLEHHLLDTRSVREWLARLHHIHMRVAAGRQGISDALTTLCGMARFDGAEHEVHIRLAGNNEVVYLDLGDAAWRAVEITEAGWRVVPEPPVRFRRGRSVLPLPVPVSGGSLDSLRDVIHVRSDADWRLMVAWLEGALRPKGPYPLLGLEGEQGTGKSTRARMLRRTIDPSAAELRAEPREIRDLMVAAVHGWIIAFDNVSHLQPWLSDALCRISTGGALSTRELYTNGDEYIMEAIRPVIITGITSVITRGDLQDRTINLTLPPISDVRRRTEAELWQVYEEKHPALLGALLDAVSCALRRERDIQAPSLPRMADWIIWAEAAAPALGCQDGAILAAYRENRSRAVDEALDGDALAIAVRALTKPWVGTADELLQKLTPAPPVPRGWPQSPRGLSGGLRRLAPQLRDVGINIEFNHREGHTGRRLLHITDNPRRPSPSSPSSPSSQVPALLTGTGDDRTDPQRAIVTTLLCSAARSRGGDAGDGGDGPDGGDRDDDRYVSDQGREALCSERDYIQLGDRIGSRAALELLLSLEDRGFAVQPIGDRLDVQPACQLTEHDVVAIHRYGDELYRLVVHCSG